MFLRFVGGADREKAFSLTGIFIPREQGEPMSESPQLLERMFMTVAPVPRLL